MRPEQKKFELSMYVYHIFSAAAVCLSVIRASASNIQILFFILFYFPNDGSKCIYIYFVVPLSFPPPADVCIYSSPGQKKGGKDLPTDLTDRAGKKIVLQCITYIHKKKNKEDGAAACTYVEATRCPTILKRSSDTCAPWLYTCPGWMPCTYFLHDSATKIV